MKMNHLKAKVITLILLFFQFLTAIITFAENENQINYWEPLKNYYFQGGFYSPLKDKMRNFTGNFWYSLRGNYIINSKKTNESSLALNFNAPNLLKYKRGSYKGINFSTKIINASLLLDYKLRFGPSLKGYYGFGLGINRTKSETKTQLPFSLNSKTNLCGEILIGFKNSKNVYTQIRFFTAGNIENEGIILEVGF